MPKPVEALPCGSRSTISTCSPMAASAVPRLMAVVVLPTPPFWLAMAMTRGAAAGPAATGLVKGTTCGSAGVFGSIVSVIGLGLGLQTADYHDAAIRARLALHLIRLNSPIFSGFGQF